MVNSGAIATTSLMPGGSAGEKWQLPVRRPLPLRRPGARARGRRLPLGLGDEHAQPRHRVPAARSRPRRLRPARGARPLHAPELPRRDCPGSRRDGRHARRRRRQSGDRRARGRRREVPAHARGHDDRGPLRDVGRTGSTTSACPPRAASAAASSPSRPARAGSATFAPLLDGAGNSVKGQRVAKFLSHRLGLHILASEPLEPPIAPSARG